MRRNPMIPPLDHRGALTPEVAFTSIALFNVIKLPLFFFPAVIQVVIEAGVSYRRIKVVGVRRSHGVGFSSLNSIGMAFCQASHLLFSPVHPQTVHPLRGR